MKIERQQEHSERKIRFAEAGILFVLILAISVFVGVKFVGKQSAATAPETVAGLANSTLASPGADTTSVEAAWGGAETFRAPGADGADGTAHMEDNEMAEPTVATPVSYATAEAAFFDGRYTEAIELFTAYAEQHPDNAWGRYMLGLACWKSGHPDDAEAALLAALALKPDHVKSLVNLGRVLLEQDRGQEALPYLEKAVTLAPENGDAYRVLGRVYHRLQQSSQAIEAYRQAIKRDHDDAWALNNLGLLYIESERFEEALAPLALATQLQADQACIQNNLGIALERTKHEREAARAYERALEADAGYSKAELSLIRIQGRTPATSQAPLDLAAVAEAFLAQLRAESTEPPQLATAALNAVAGPVSQPPETEAPAEPDAREN
jgi:Flp pilus assembly protein TadD